MQHAGALWYKFNIDWLINSIGKQRRKVHYGTSLILIDWLIPLVSSGVQVHYGTSLIFIDWLIPLLRCGVQVHYGTSLILIECMKRIKKFSWNKKNNCSNFYLFTQKLDELLSIKSNLFSMKIAVLDVKYILDKLLFFLGQILFRSKSL